MLSPILDYAKEKLAQLKARRENLQHKQKMSQKDAKPRETELKIEKDFHSKEKHSEQATELNPMVSFLVVVFIIVSQIILILLISIAGNGINLIYYATLEYFIEHVQCFFVLVLLTTLLLVYLGIQLFEQKHFCSRQDEFQDWYCVT